MKKNGRPIDHLRENFPSPEPLPDSMIMKYFTHRDSILKLLDKMELKTKKYNSLVNYGFEAKYLGDEL